MRVSLDSNVWEWLFGASAETSVPRGRILAALRSRRLSAFICDAAVRIEAVTKKHRPSYLASSAPLFGPTGIVELDGRPHLQFSLMPDDRRHPGVPGVQADKLALAQERGVRLMRGLSWISLPRAQCGLDYVAEAPDQRGQRETLQHAVFDGLSQSGVGKARFDGIIERIDKQAGRSLPGWSGLARLGDQEFKRLGRACSEWADAELVAAHVSYGNDLLCTEDYARRAGRSVFDRDQRRWLSNRYGVRFITIGALTNMLEVPQ